MQKITISKKNYLIERGENKIYLFKDIITTQMPDENNIPNDVSLEFVTMAYVQHPIACKLSYHLGSDEEKYFPPDYKQRERSYYLKFKTQKENIVFPDFYICQLLTNFKNLQQTGEIFNTLDKQIHYLLKHQSIEGTYSVGLAVALGKLGKYFNKILEATTDKDKIATQLFKKITKIKDKRPDILSKQLLSNIIKTFIKHLENNLILKKCEHHTCNIFFTYRSNKKYCSERCRHLSADHRRYHKKEYEKQ